MIYNNDIQQELKDLLTELEVHTSKSDNLLFTDFENRHELNAFIKTLYSKLDNQDISLLKELHFAFLPTSIFQELSAKNGWETSYLNLATRLDEILAKVGYNQGKGPDRR